MEGFLRYEFFWGGLYLEGLIHGGTYFRNFTVPFLKKNLIDMFLQHYPFYLRDLSGLINCITFISYVIVFLDD